MVVKNLDVNNFEDEIVNSEIPVVIDFYADWCGPCQMMKPVFEGLSSEYDGKLKFMKLDTQSEEGLAMKFGIQGIPALVFVDNSKEIGRLVGYMSEDDLRAGINKILSSIK